MDVRLCEFCQLSTYMILEVGTRWLLVNNWVRPLGICFDSSLHPCESQVESWRAFRYNFFHSSANFPHCL